LLEHLLGTDAADQSLSARADADGHAHGDSDRHAGSDSDGHGDRDSDGHGDRDTHGDADRDTHGDADRDTHGHADRDSNGHGDRDSHGHGDRDTHGDADRDTHGHPDSDCDGHADRDADGHADSDCDGHTHRDAYGNAADLLGATGELHKEQGLLLEHLLGTDAADQDLPTGADADRDADCRTDGYADRDTHRFAATRLTIAENQGLIRGAPDAENCATTSRRGHATHTLVRRVAVRGGLTGRGSAAG
jgi:hypothetical protein